jgi:inner membrane protein
MASAFSHAAVALAVTGTWRTPSVPTRVYGLSVLCSVLPDVDVLGFAIGIDYGDLWGHRGLTHSLAFALLVGVVVASGFRSASPGSPMWSLLVMHFSLVTASHGLLDAMTNGGLGVAFFAPFDTTRYFFPWRPILVSPIGVEAFFSRYGFQVLLSELMWIWIPTGLVVGCVMLGRRLRR